MLLIVFLSFLVVVHGQQVGTGAGIREDNGIGQSVNDNKIGQTIKKNENEIGAGAGIQKEGGIGQGIGGGSVKHGGIGQGIESTGGIGQGIKSTNGIGQGIESTGGIGQAVRRKDNGIGQGIGNGIGQGIGDSNEGIGQPILKKEEEIGQSVGSRARRFLFAPYSINCNHNLGPRVCYRFYEDGDFSQVPKGFSCWKTQQANPRSPLNCTENGFIDLIFNAKADTEVIQV